MRDSPREAVSTILTMFDIVLAALRGELLSKFGRRHEERTELIMSASRGILLSSFLVCAAGLSNTNEFNFPIIIFQLSAKICDKNENRKLTSAR